MNKNMYEDSIFQWNIFKGCHFDCVYCRKSYQLQAKRQKHRCQACYDYTPHLHLERLQDDWIKKNLPKKTEGDQFIWCCSSGDISFLNKGWMQTILDKIKTMPDLTFFMQTKNPQCFWNLNLPENIILGITLETNRGKDYDKISGAQIPPLRVLDFIERIWDRKFITIEPILDFDMDNFIDLITEINPERIYIGYDTKKCKLPEPSLKKTLKLIKKLREKGFYVKEKLIRKAWWEEK